MLHSTIVCVRGRRLWSLRRPVMAWFALIVAVTVTFRAHALLACSLTLHSLVVCLIRGRRSPCSWSCLIRRLPYSWSRLIRRCDLRRACCGSYCVVVVSKNIFVSKAFGAVFLDLISFLNVFSIKPMTCDKINFIKG